MSKMIQIRTVPDELHRTLKAKAAAKGMTLSDYLLELAEREANRVSWEEMSARIKQARPRTAREPRGRHHPRAPRAVA